MFFYFVGMVAPLIVAVLIVIAVYLYRKNKKRKGVICLIMTIPFFIIFYIALPFHIVSYVKNSNSDDNMHLIKFAAKTAIFPSDLKSEITSIPALDAQLILRSQRFYSGINDKERNYLINKMVYYYNKACFAKNHSVNACVELSYVYGLLGKYDEAIYVYEKLYFERSEDIFANKELINYYILNKDYEGALNALKTLRFNEDSRILYSAEVYRHMGKYNVALNILNKYLKTHQYKADALKYRAYVYYDMGKIKQSKSDYLTLVKIKGTGGLYKNYEYFIKNSDIEWVYDRIRENDGLKPLKS